MVKVHFDAKIVQDNINHALNKKLKSIYYDNIEDEIAGIYAKYIAKYVPYKTGRLLHSAKIEDGAVVYSAKVNRPGGRFDYAAIQYYFPFPPEHRSTPGTYDHWNKHLTRAEREAFYEEVQELLVKHMNGGH